MKVETALIFVIATQLALAAQIHYRFFFNSPPTARNRHNKVFSSVGIGSSFFGHIYNMVEYIKLYRKIFLICLIRDDD